MKKTVGPADRTVRGVLAVGSLIGAGILGFGSGWGILLLIVAAIMAVTGASGYCPIFSLLGIDSLPRSGSGGASQGLLHAHRTA
jgi:hypothetical protein